ncbi:MAG: type II toxin-antitoxin system VapC family toxin [Tardiphaga sp.]
MIAVDTSALMAVALNESAAARCSMAFRSDPQRVMSAVTLAEVMVVASSKNVLRDMTEILDGLGCEIVPVSAETAMRVSQIYRLWGKGRHPARLNFADCFAYDAARSHNCPLLFVGEDFRKTDVVSVL